MVDCLTHYFKPGTMPFRSLSALSEIEAVQIMHELYNDNVLWARFKDPVQYLHDRKQTEKWVREEFISKGCRPLKEYPIYMVLGTSDWIEKNSSKEDMAKIQIPLSAFDEDDVSFTYPDSMISFWFGRDKPIEYYMVEYHGKIFTRSEILSIINKNGMPEENWKTNLPVDLAPYIEAQVWNQEPLWDFYNKLKQIKRSEKVSGKDFSVNISSGIPLGKSGGKK